MKKIAAHTYTYWQRSLACPGQDQWSYDKVPWFKSLAIIALCSRLPSLCNSVKVHCKTTKLTFTLENMKFSWSFTWTTKKKNIQGQKDSLTTKTMLVWTRPPLWPFTCARRRNILQKAATKEVRTQNGMENLVILLADSSARLPLSKTVKFCSKQHSFAYQTCTFSIFPEDCNRGCEWYSGGKMYAWNTALKVPITCFSSLHILYQANFSNHSTA